MTHGIQRLDLSEALVLLETQLAPLTERQNVTLARARNRISATTIAAPISLPPFRSSAMDGYAARHADLRMAAQLPIVGTSAAGHPYLDDVPAGACLRILTGAVVPDALDTVIIQEDVSVDTDSITIQEAPSKGANIRAVGHDVNAGERLIAEGVRFGAFELAWLNACGIAEVSARRPLRVGLLATGDELKPPGTTLAPGQIYDSNRLLIQQLLINLPVEVVDLGVLPDNRQVIYERIAGAATNVDLLISTGGVSVGDADFITEVVAELGELQFWRLNLKPGKPMAMGKIDDCWFFGLPGNPVSCAVTCLLIVRPALLRLAGAKVDEPLTLRAQLAEPVTHRRGRQEFLRGTLKRQSNPEQSLMVIPTGDQSSNRLASFQQANCLIDIPKNLGDLPAGAQVDVICLADLL